MKAFRADTMTELNKGLCEYVANAPASKLDLVTSVDVQLHDVVATADRMEWEFDLKQAWLTPQRWTMMVRQYLDSEELVNWLNRSAQLIGPGGRGISTMRTKLVKPRGGKEFGNKETRRWGSCMLAISYKALPHPQINLYSRTSYLGYLGALDLTVAWMCGRYLATVMNMPVEDFQFVWMNQNMQYHNFKSLAYLLNHPDEEARVRYRRLLLELNEDLTDEEDLEVSSSPALLYSRRWMQKLLKEDRDGITLGDMTYNTYRRVKRRFHTEVMGYEYAQKFEGWQYYKKGPQAGEQKEFFGAYKPLPHTSVEDLDFRALGLPGIDNLFEIEYDADVAAKMSEEEDDE